MAALKGALDYYREHLDPEALKQFHFEFYNQWAIETGQIEGVYDIPDGITETFIKSGVDAALLQDTPGGLSARQIESIIRDHQDALEGLFDFVKTERPISTSFIRQLHQQLLRSVDEYETTDSNGTKGKTPLEKGKYKSLPNHWRHRDGNLHEYCPPEHVDAEMDRLVAIHAEHTAKGVPAEIATAWLHHCFTQIHPFPDGNGRVARALASAVLIKAGILPLLVTRTDRERYVKPLREADEGDLSGFITFVRSAQRTAIVRLSGHVRTHLDPPRTLGTLDDRIRAIRADLVNQGKVAHPRWADLGMRAVERLRKLHALTLRRAEEASSKLKDAFSGIDSRFSFVASTFSYGANRENGPLIQGGWSSASGAQLYYHPPGDGLKIFFYPVGAQPRGLAGAHCQYLYNAEGKAETLGDPFLIYFSEDEADTERRFDRWLDERIGDSLERWKGRLSL